MLHPSLNPHLFSPQVEKIPTRNGYGDGLLELSETKPEVMVLTGDLAESTRVLAFWKKYPERFVECGVAEQNMMGVAAGLALAGKIPFVSSYAVFVPGRTWDQTRVSVCYSKSNVKIAGAHSGISVGPDGATHQALEDIAITRVLPNMTVIVPCDAEETRKCTLAVAQMQGPAYFRFAREKTPVITTVQTPFEIGKSILMRTGEHVTLVGCGPLLHEALLAAHELSRDGIEAEVINMHTIKPFDHAALEASVLKTGCVVTIEEHQVAGGLAGAVAESLGRHHPVPMESIGMQDSFGESGEPDELLTKYGMRAKDIVLAVHDAILRKQKNLKR
ncbi:transketolase family protein [Candidatus Uhrbacteria bacterium]|nr:transketolase family protein [Candidatus Uhrbacteria bacterium]